MTEEGKESSSEGSWWGTWINSAKLKTSTVLEAVKKDLDELTTVVRTEASNVGSAIGNTLQLNEEQSPVGNVKKSLSSFFGQVTEALIPSIEDDEVEAVLITREGAITLTGFQKHLIDLQNDDKTYLEEPNKELQDKYKLWMEVIEQDQFTQDRLARHLASSEILNEKYLNLVPEKVPHMEFWQRYLFKRALLEDAVANAEIAERRAKNELNSTKSISPRKNIIQTEQPKLSYNEKDINDDNSGATKIIENENNIKEQLQNEKINDQQHQKQKSEIENLNVAINDDEILDDINWGSEEISSVELTEEEQIKLLEQYEQEIQEREKKGKRNNNKANKPKTSLSLTTSKIESAAINENDDNFIVQKDNFTNNNKDETSSTSDESWEKDFDLND